MANNSLGYVSRSTARASDSLPLLSTSDTTSRILAQVLVARNAGETLASWRIRKFQWRATEMAKVGVQVLLGEAEGAGVVHPGEWRALWGGWKRLALPTVRFTRRASSLIYCFPFPVGVSETVFYFDEMQLCP